MTFSAVGPCVRGGETACVKCFQGFQEISFNYLLLHNKSPQNLMA